MTNKDKRVLIVDDSVDDIHIIMEHLRDSYAVLAETSGEKAVETAKKEPRPDVILMDVEMPGMKGYEACRLIKENAVTKDIDVIFVSAHDTVEEKLAGYEAGGSDYVVKPLSPEELLQKIQLAIKNREIRTTLEAEKNIAMETAMTALSSTGR